MVLIPGQTTLTPPAPAAALIKTAASRAACLIVWGAVAVLASGACGVCPAAVESFRKVLQAEPNHVYALHGLGIIYATTGDKTAAVQQYYILKDLNADVAADLLGRLSK